MKKPDRVLRAHTHFKLSLLFLVISFLFPAHSFSAEGNFYTLNDRWQKANESGQTKKEALESGFSSALAQQSFSSPTLIPTPPSITRDLIEISQQGNTFQLELGQSLFVKDSNGIVKFVATDEGIVSFETINSNTLRIGGSGIGKTFVHIWDSKGRTTFEMWVIPPKFIPTASQLRQIETMEKSRSFSLGYSNSRSAFYMGDTFRNMGRSTLDFYQNFTLLGDTPYGTLSSHVETQKDRAKTLLADAQVALEDGKIGPYRNFNLYGGDSAVKPHLIVFSEARIRGGDLQHWDDKKRVQWEGFYGRELTSIIGTISPELVSKRTKNSYLSGGVMDFKLNDDARIKGGYFNGFGQDRADELNRHGFGLQGDVNFGKHIKFKPETDFDNERFAQKHDLLLNFEKMQVKGQLRNIDKKFQTMLGAPSQQGELGYLIDVSANPTENISFLGTFDAFRDRIIPNPADLNAWNMHTDMSLTFVPWERSSAILTYQDLDDTGRLAPMRQRVIGAQYNQQFEIYHHRINSYIRYQNRNNRFLTNPTSDYLDNKVVMGLQTELFWGIIFSAQQEWNQLDEPNVPQTTYPCASIYDLSYSHRILDTPFFMEARLRIRDEQNVESQNSFMTGEDSTEISGGIYYREYDNLEVFLTGRFEQFVPESTYVTDPRVEAQFLTGMKYTFDTKFRWETVGSFAGYVFKDLNADGIRQPNEPGLAGMIVKSNDKKEGVANQEGYYQIQSISGRKAVLTLDSSKIPYGYIPTTPVQQEAPIVQNRTQIVNFGVMPRSEVTGIIFSDLNGNGKYDPTDKGVAKVRITLETGASERSSPKGVYTFSNVVAGDHTAAMELKTLPIGYLPEDVPKKTFTVFEGIRYELNFPLRAQRVVNGRVFVDENRNGMMDANEKGLANVNVKLGTQSSLTDKEGWYLFDNMNGGIYELSLDETTLPAGHKAAQKFTIDLPAEPITITDKNIPVETSAAPVAEQGGQ